MTGCILPAFSGGGRELSPTALAPLNPLSGWLNDNCQGKPWFKKKKQKQNNSVKISILTRRNQQPLSLCHNLILVIECKRAAPSK